MDDPLISAVLERLDADATKTGETENLVLGALLGRLDESTASGNRERFA